MPKRRDSGSGSGSHYFRMQAGSPSVPFLRRDEERIFDELPSATVIDASRSEGLELSQFQLLYTIEIRYKQFQWRLVKKASQVLMLHFDLKKRALFEDLQEKQEQVKEWLQNLGLGEHSGAAVSPGHFDEDYLEESHSSLISRRDVPSSAAFPVIRPALGRLSSVSLKAIASMQGYLNHFLDSLDIVNTREVCKFLEVSKLSFKPEYGPKLREGYVSVKHLQRIHSTEESSSCSCCRWMPCCNDNWQKVWAVLKPGFLALVADPCDAKLLDIVVFDVLSSSDGKSDGRIGLAKLSRERNPLYFAFTVACGNRTIKIRSKRAGNARDWVAAINDAGLRPPEGWCHPHRYGSFAPPRGTYDDGSEAQWFIDGEAAFNAIALAIEQAKSEIFIAGWWLCPELYLRRPFAEHEQSRLDALLQKKAQMGVKIYILLYKELALALKINSMYSKRRLLTIHENVKVLRYPNHFASGVYLWSHHEKIVIVDHQVCFLGGLDLCFGRYDNWEHKVCDSTSTTWPGKDYYNPRELEPNSWEDAMKDELNRQLYPRMPWHDVHCAIWGPACRDVARHFVQRWNYAKRSKAPYEPGIPLLLPHHHMVLPHYHSTGYIDVPALIEVSKENEQDDQSTSARSSYQDIPLLVPREGEVGEGSEGNSREREADETISGDGKLGDSKRHCFKCSSDTSSVQMHDFALDQDSGAGSMKVNGSNALENGFHQEWWHEQIRDGQLSNDEPVGQVGPRVSCSCQVLRSVGFWSAGTSQSEETSIHSAYCSLISKAEHFVYIENQFFISGFDDDDVICNRVLQALYDRIMQAHNDRRCFRVIVVIPLLPGFQGGVDDAGAATVRAIMHWQYRTISRGRYSLLHRLQESIGSELDNYVSFYGLRNYGKLSESCPHVTSQVYVHSKIMIIDDRAVLIGSANINDRSLLGSRDSEVAVVLEDKEFIDSYMDSRPWKAGRLAHWLRMSLWAEHLGLAESEMNVLMDPVCETTYKHIWMTTAKMNTVIYEKLFGCIPNDHIHTRSALRQSIAKEKEKLGHTTIDLGMAINDIPVQFNGFSDLSVTSIRGLLVSFSLHFLKEEDLRPVFKESEYYASAQVFH
ncbi:hypothetical protein GOP47_0020026 [Adiantum capillus-veneris]|uniref:Phospholipase n=1 Tax=Adiantum capillus-veneris TaxID=13818 RepID=A0A9D4UC78_ADICA|nr:hypothetical protein GOP47_0020026 [Adiantum capillus-veneris]